MSHATKKNPPKKLKPKHRHDTQMNVSFSGASVATVFGLLQFGPRALCTDNSVSN